MYLFYTLSSHVTCLFNENMIPYDSCTNTNQIREFKSDQGINYTAHTHNNLKLIYTQWGDLKVKLISKD